MSRCDISLTTLSIRLKMEFVSACLCASVWNVYQSVSLCTVSVVVRLHLPVTSLRLDR